jgi:Family of unknown function (DUF6334)
MSNLDVLHEVAEKAGPLRRVCAARFDGDANFVTDLRLEFEGIALVVSAEGDLDTVLLRIGDLANGPNTTVREVTEDAPWSHAIGLIVRWGWELTNQQGCADGVRFEFANPDGGTSVEIELIVMASALQAYRCEPTPRSGRARTDRREDRAMARLEGMRLILAVRNLRAATDFYVNALGFRRDFGDESDGWSWLSRDNFRVGLDRQRRSRGECGSSRCKHQTVIA